MIRPGIMKDHKEEFQAAIDSFSATISNIELSLYFAELVLRNAARNAASEVRAEELRSKHAN